MKNKATIAVVNDERNILNLMRMFLEAEGFRVRTYANTADALELIENPADLAFIDKTNPPLGGMELYRRIRARHDMPVIFLSAWAEEIELALRGTGWEAEGYIETPFSQRGIIDSIRTTLLKHPPKPSVVIVAARRDAAE